MLGIISLYSQSHMKAVALLSMTTFLEYFDLMLYLHMAVVLNDLFFPTTDPDTSKLLAATGYASTFLLRPIWALIIGKIGDNKGRKATVMITILLCCIACTTMAILPTYSQIGIIATGLFIMCRIIQGFAAMGEAVGADIYIMETIKPPLLYPISGLTTIFASLGGFAALAFTSFVISFNFNWRFAFCIGAFVTLITAIGRKALNETPEFLDAVSKIAYKKVKKSQSELVLDKKTSAAIFAIDCGWPIGFYFLYMYCNDILKEKFFYSAQDIIDHNLIISVILLCNHIFITCLSYKFDPLKMLKYRVFLFTALVLFYPYLLSQVTSAEMILAMQILLALTPIDLVSATPIILKQIPVLKRFTYSAFIYSISRAVMHAIISFGFIYLIRYLGDIGPLILILPVMICCICGVLYFEKITYSLHGKSLI